jgi:hypothetical protein
MEVSASLSFRDHPTQFRVMRHRVGCADTQKRWVGSRDLYFFGVWDVVSSSFMHAFFVIFDSFRLETEIF